MNSLSWLIYASNVIPNLGILFFLVGVASTIFILIMIVVTAMNNDEALYSWSSRTVKTYPKFKFWLVPITAFFFCAVIPTRETILLIAGSEIGEKVIETDVGQQAIRILKNKLSEIELEQTRKKTQ